MSEVIHLELDCVSGEKLIFHRSTEPGALVTVTIRGHRVQETVQVKPEAFWLAVMAFNDTEPSAITQVMKK